MERKTLFNGFFVVLLAFMLYQGGRIILPSGGALLGAAVLAVVFYPVHQWLGRFIPNRTVRAVLSNIFVFTFFFIPLGMLVWAAIAQSDTILAVAQPAAARILEWAPTAPAKILSGVENRFPWLAEQLSAPSAVLKEYLANFANRSVTSLARFGAEAAKATAIVIGYVFLAIVALFFFFRDGEGLIKTISDLLPLRADLKQRLEEKIRTMVVGVVRGAILTSMVQGVVATLGYLVLHTPSAFLLGFATMIASIIPAIGSALIWGPICFYYFWTGALSKGVFLLIWGLLVIGLIDNLLRPWLVGAKQDVPFFWLFFSIVGGIQVFGLFGILIGPLVMAVLILLLDIYHQVYLQSGEPAPEARPVQTKASKRRS